MLLLVDVADPQQRRLWLSMSDADNIQSTDPVEKSDVLWYRAYSAVQQLLTNFPCLGDHLVLFDLTDADACVLQFQQPLFTMFDCAWSVGFYAILLQLLEWQQNVCPSDSDEEDDAIVQQLITGNNQDLTNKFGLPVWIWFLRDACDWSTAQVRDMRRVFLVSVPNDEAIKLLVLYASGPTPRPSG